ncbi:MAG: hypothetical protein ACK4OM_06180 [Alphaproteobacteria bacterium]
MQNFKKTDLFKLIDEGKIEQVKMYIKDSPIEFLNEAIVIAATKKKWKILKYIICEHPHADPISKAHIKEALKLARKDFRPDIVDLLNSHIEKPTFISMLSDSLIFTTFVNYSKAIANYIPIKLCDKLIALSKPITAKFEIIIDKFIKHFPISNEAQNLSKNILKSSIPLIIAYATLKGIYTCFKEWQRGVSGATIAKDTVYATGEAFIDGATAAIATSITVAAVSAIGITGFAASVAPIAVSSAACGAVKGIGYFTNRILEQRNNNANKIINV